MDSTTNNGMCRCCASEGTYKDVISKYSWMGDEEIYSDMLKQCFDIDLCVSSDGDNGGICEVCITQLRNAANFKKQVLHTEEQFKKHLQEKLYKSNIVKVEVHKSEDIESDNNASDDYSAPEFEVPIKEEINEVAKPKKRAAAAKATSSSAAKKPKTEIGETSTKRKQQKLVNFDPPPLEEPGKEISKPKTPLKETKKLRENLRNILLYSNASLIRCKDSDGYGCNFCQKKFPEPKNLKTHILEEHNDVKLLKLPNVCDHVLKLDITNLKCKLCNEKFHKLDNFTTHLRKEHKINIYTDIKNQIIPFKFNTESLRCAICETEFTTFKILHEHMQIHFRNYLCNVCSAGYVTKRLLVAHKRSHGLGEFKCDHCEKIFNCDQKRRDHEQRVHLGLKKHKCKLCDEKFSDYWVKIDHMVKMHDVPRVVLKCRACDRTFKTQKTLSAHTRKHHLMVRDHKCTECEMKFFTPSCLRSHMTKHTGVRQYKCDVCFRAYVTKKTLREHMRKHADERRFVCVHCGQKFVQKCSLKDHMRSKHSVMV